MRFLYQSVYQSLCSDFCHFEYHPKVLERLHLLQCISAHLQNTLPWVSWEAQYLNLFSVEFRSCLVARSRKPIKRLLKTLLRRSTHAVPIRPQKANGPSCNSHQWHPRRCVCDSLSNSYRSGLSKFLEENYISDCRTVWGLETLRNMFFSGYVTFYQFYTFFLNILFFNPLTTTRATIVAHAFLVITRHLLQLERCANPLRIQQV